MACTLSKEDATTLIERWYSPIDDSAYKGVAAWWNRKDFIEAVAERYILWYPHTREWAKQEDLKRAEYGSNGRLKRSTQEKFSIKATTLLAIAEALALHANPENGRDCKPTIAILARDSGHTIAAVERALRLLTLWKLRVVIRKGRFFTPAERSLLHRYATGAKRTHRGLATIVALSPNPQTQPHLPSRDKSFEGLPLAVPSLRDSIGVKRSRRISTNSRPGENPRASRPRRGGPAPAPHRTAPTKRGSTEPGAVTAARIFQQHPLCPTWASKDMTPYAVARQMNKHIREGREPGFFIGALEFWPYHIPHNPGKNRYGLLGQIFKLYAQFCSEHERIKHTKPHTPHESHTIGTIPSPAIRHNTTIAATDTDRLPNPQLEPGTPPPAVNHAVATAPKPITEQDTTPLPHPAHHAMRNLTGIETPEQRHTRIQAQLTARDENTFTPPTPEQNAARRALIAQYWKRKHS